MNEEHEHTCAVCGIVFTCQCYNQNDQPDDRLCRRCADNQREARHPHTRRLTRAVGKSRWR